MNKKEFLKTTDENILEVEISDTRDKNDKSEVCAFLTIGQTDKQIQKHLESLTKEEIENNKMTFQQFEILLSKKHLQYLLDRIEKEEKYIEKNGVPSYVGS